MQILFDREHEVFKIDTVNDSYVIGIADGKYVGHVYYGKKISDTDVEYLLRTEENPYVPSKNMRDKGSFLDSFPTEYSSNGVGDFREGSLCVQDKDGHEAFEPVYCGYRIYEGKPSLEGLPATFCKTALRLIESSENDTINSSDNSNNQPDAMTLEIDVKDEATQIVATLRYSVFTDSDAIARSVLIKNESESKVVLKKVMSMCIDFDNNDYQMLTLHGSWARERQMDYRTIGYGKQSVGSIRGETSHQEHPFVGIVSKNVTQDTGEVYGFQFVYSGNFLAQVEKNQFDSLRVVMGIHPEKFSFNIQPGESFTAPEVIMTHSSEGLGKMSRTFHDLIRNHLIRSPYKDKKRPILINNWEATYFNFDTDKLIDIAKEAKKSGIEMLVMDDGWFGERDDDNSSLGDWQVNENKLKGGLKYLVDEVNRIGLKFGIWFEPEMISPVSKLYEQHPDWAIQIPGRTPCRSRNQYVLDITRKEVWDCVYKQVSDVLHSANIAYVKWDMNRQLTDIGSYSLGHEYQGELMHRYVLAVYALQERLLHDFPELLLENCSGGGARYDAGMLYYSPQIWCSDDTDAIERLGIQEGTALLYPLSTMGAHVSDCPNHTVGRVTPFETRGYVALAGTFGYELDVTRIPEEDREMIPEQVAMYHKYNDLVRNGDYYRISSYRENHFYDCYGVVAKDKSEALITFIQVLNRPNFHSRIIKIPGLDPMSTYKIEGEDRTYQGDTLMNAGLPVQNMWGDFQGKLIHLIKQ